MKYQRYILTLKTIRMRRINIIVYLFLFSLCLINAPAWLCKQATAGWQIEVVTTAPVLNFSHLAFDLSGRPAIAFVTAPTAVMPLFYAARLNVNGTTWGTIPVTTNSWLPSLAFNALGNPAIAASRFRSDIATGIFYAQFNGISWDITTVDPVGSQLSSSLAFDLSGNPAIAYSTGDIKFAHFNGTSWDITTVDSARGGAHLPCL